MSWGILKTTLSFAVLAWTIIPQTWEIVLFDGLFVYNSWRLFLTMSGLPTLVGFGAIIFFPESPKFLMTQGRNDEAMAIFKRMFTMNTGKSPDQYPVSSANCIIAAKYVKCCIMPQCVCREQVSSLEDENVAVIVTYGSEKSVPKSIAVSESGRKQNSRTVLRELCEGLKQMKPLFSMPHLPRLLLVVSIQFGGMLAWVCDSGWHQWIDQISLKVCYFFVISTDTTRFAYGSRSCLRS